MKLNITKESACSIQVGGLARVHIWLFEPCIHSELTINGGSPFIPCTDEEDKEYEDIRDNLKDILYFNDGVKRFRPASGDLIPKEMLDLHDQDKMRFEWEVFNAGDCHRFRRIMASHMFGFDGPIAEKIWDKVCQSFNNEDFDDWDKIPHLSEWNWCETIDVDFILK